MLDGIVSLFLGASTVLSFAALIDGVIAYRNDPFLEWVRQYNEQFNTEDDEED